MYSLELDKIAQKMYDGELGEGVRQSMEILFAMGKIYGAKRMIPITSAQISGVSYKTIGDAGLEYLEQAASKGAKVRVPSLLNPAGMDRDQWSDMGFPNDFASKQLRILEAYSRMGITMSCTCTPYLIGLKPNKGEHVAWAESSAVAYANSVLGARTNREGGPSALAAAVCGFTPEYGLHLEANRSCSVVVDIEARLKTTSDFGAMGSFLGPIVKNRNVAFSNLKSATNDNLKGLGAAMAASGSVALFNVKGITPEYNVSDGVERISFTSKDLAAARSALGTNEKPDLITIGCPHASIDEIKEVADMVAGKKVSCELWICTAKQTKEVAIKLGYARTIEDAGGRIVADTCMVVCPLEDMGHKVTACNSGKAAKYLASLCKQKVVFGNTGDIICK